jgi:hypothetical protein
VYLIRELQTFSEELICPEDVDSPFLRNALTRINSVLKMETADFSKCSIAT